MSRVSITITAVLALALAILAALRHTATHDARQQAARLLGCPADQLDVSMEHFGNTDAWRVEGCGIRGTLRCESPDPGCIVIPDGE